MLEAVFELLVPLVMAAVIDTGIAQKDTAYIIQMCFVMVLLGGVGLICSVTAQYFSAKAACGFGTKTRHALFAHIQKLSFTKLDQAGTSALITRMTSDVNQVQNGVNMVLRLFLRSPFIVLGAMVMAFTIDIKSAVYFVIAIPLLSVVVFAVMYISIPLYKKVQERLDAVTLYTRENLTGVRVIRAFHLEEEEKKEERKKQEGKKVRGWDYFEPKLQEKEGIFIFQSYLRYLQANESEAKKAGARAEDIVKLAKYMLDSEIKADERIQNEVYQIISKKIDITENEFEVLF